MRMGENNPIEEGPKHTIVPFSGILTLEYYQDEQHEQMNQCKVEFWFKVALLFLQTKIIKIMCASMIDCRTTTIKDQH
jgi:hypothetical protein